MDPKPGLGLRALGLCLLPVVLVGVVGWLWVAWVGASSGWMQGSIQRASCREVSGCLSVSFFALPRPPARTPATAGPFLRHQHEGTLVLPAALGPLWLSLACGISTWEGQTKSILVAPAAAMRLLHPSINPPTHPPTYLYREATGVREENQKLLYTQASLAHDEKRPPPPPSPSPLPPPPPPPSQPRSAHRPVT